MFDTHRPAGPPALAVAGARPATRAGRASRRRLRLRRMSRGALIERDAERRLARGRARRDALDGPRVAGPARGRGRRGQDALRRGGARVRRTPTSCAARRARGRSPTARSSPRCAGSCAPCPGGLVGLRSAALASRAAAAGARRRASRRATAPRSFEAIRCGLAAIAAERPGGRAARRPPVVRRRHARAARRARRLAARAAHARGRRLPLGRDPARASAPAAAQRPAPQPPAVASWRSSRSPREGTRGARRARARRRPVRAARRHAARPHRRHPVLRRGARRGARSRRPAAAAATTGVDLALDADVPLPQTIRDAVLLRAGDLSDAGPRDRRGGVGRRAPASTSSSWPRSAARRASTSCSPAA